MMSVRFREHDARYLLHPRTPWLCFTRDHPRLPVVWVWAEYDDTFLDQEELFLALGVLDGDDDWDS